MDGGPTVADIHAMLRGASTAPDADCDRFFDAVAFNWLIAGTDAHAKNYSILHAAGPQLRLAPLYDLISVLPYPQLHHDRSAMAMSVGGERRIAAIDARHWRQLAKSMGVNPESAVDRVRAMAMRIPDAVQMVRSANAALSDAVITHAAECARRL